MDFFPINSIYECAPRDHLFANWFFMLVVNINVETGGGYSFPDKFKTYYHAFDALMRFRPGSKLVERIPNSNK